MLDEAGKCFYSAFMKKNNNHLGGRIKSARERLGLTQTKLGEILGVSNKAISFYETGVSEPSLESVNKIAELVQCSIDWLMTGRDRENVPDPPTTPSSLGEKEQKAVQAAEDLLAHYGLDSRFRIVKIHQPPPTETLCPNVQELLDIWDALDPEYRVDLLKAAREKRIVYEVTLKKEVVRHIEAAKFQELKEVEALKADLSGAGQDAGGKKGKKAGGQSSAGDGEPQGSAGI